MDIIKKEGEKLPEVLNSENRHINAFRGTIRNKSKEIVFLTDGAELCEDWPKAVKEALGIDGDEKFEYITDMPDTYKCLKLSKYDLAAIVLLDDMKVLLEHLYDVNIQPYVKISTGCNYIEYDNQYCKPEVYVLRGYLRDISLTDFLNLFIEECTKHIKQRWCLIRMEPVLSFEITDEGYYLWEARMRLGILPEVTNYNETGKQ